MKGPTMFIAAMFICVALNFIVMFIKYERERYFDLFLDVSVFVVIIFIFSGTNEARAIGTFASALVSVYLFIRPPQLPKDLL